VPTRDPRVALRIIAQLPDGSPPEGLAVSNESVSGNAPAVYELRIND
jgi:hypothetical protein